mmetsp:Transcript_35/g.89  ORF Transcript_35/g.89 Transcript_35/m.89 type:complete len:267 (+) Transcript_35:119-919(+)|eukprot:CAMPEP_0171328096 /NCGR_PEP_ID=MMETSP0878-20121228/443_1 /TAXON_ID=67004 /ORGANISM="Thalassiosira weissflogii, Strain CCMP1336" /LENGTH=266 /DNA_ID=CAMNT_0011827923 /DNA_START=29 /DNA_END=829 /DNA_ORIENTATION=-
MSTLPQAAAAASTATATPPPPQSSNNPYLEFQAGVTAALRSWSALKTAVEQSWGGTHSQSKAEDLRANIFQFFDGSSPTPRMNVDELEDNFMDYMEEEFGVVLEDGSERQLADLIWRMYEGCGRGDVTLAREVVALALKAEMDLKGVSGVIQSGDGDMDESDDDDEGSDGERMEEEGGHNDESEGNEQMEAISQSGNATMQAMLQGNNTEMVMAYVAENLFGGPSKPTKELPPPRQLGDPEPEKPQPEVDDDGFAMVVTKKKGKKR